MSFLPIAHIFERYLNWEVYDSGAQLWYAKYPITEFMKNIT